MDIAPQRYQLSHADREAFARYQWRAEGETPSESYLKSLCEQSFLRFWTYAGVYRKESNFLKKEVCDVMVVFDHDLIVFSDKHCSWPTAPELETNWFRWQKKAIAKSMDQLRGAKRTLDRTDNDLFLDKHCSIPFPFPLPNLAERHTHLVAVARGAAEECRSHFGGGLGTLVIFNDIESAESRPFTLSAQPKGLAFVHVFDEIGLEVVFSVLNTTKDFVSYLSAREDLLTRGDVVVAHGEEDLLALYLVGESESLWQGQFPARMDSPALIAVPENLWASIVELLDARKQAERVGMIWDQIIDEVIDYTLAGELYLAYPPNMEGQERVIRLLAREPRNRRIMLAQQLFGLVIGTPPGCITFRTIHANDDTESTFVFMVLARPPDLTEAKYRAARRDMLLMYIQALKLKLTKIKIVVGIASEPENPDSRSIDIVSIDMSHWDERDVARAEEFRDRTGFLEEYTEWRMSNEELESLSKDKVIFPTPKAKPYKLKIDRDAP